MQVFMILLNIACNMQNMQNNMHDMQNMQTSFPICRICTAHFADANSLLSPITAAADRSETTTMLVAKVSSFPAPPAFCATGTARSRPTGGPTVRTNKMHWHQQTGLRLFPIIFISTYYTRLFPIISDYFRLFYCKTQTIIRDYCIISQKTIISLVALRLFHLFFSACIIAIIAIISRLFALCLSQGITFIILFEMYYCYYFSQRKLFALCALSYYYSN